MSSLFKLFKLWTSESELQTSAACRSSKAAFTSLAILFVLNSRGSPLTTTRIQCQRVLSTFSVVFWLSRGVCAGKCCKVLMSSRIHTVESPAFEHFEQFAFELFSHSALDSVFGSQFYLFGSLRFSSLRVFSALQLSLHSSIRLSSQLYSVRLFIRLFIRLLIQCGRYSVALKPFYCTDSSLSLSLLPATGSSSNAVNQTCTRSGSPAKLSDDALDKFIRLQLIAMINCWMLIFQSTECSDSS